MSPLVLVGITLLTCALADVSHVLQGSSAHPHSDPQEINHALEAGHTPKDFWWMQDDSPLKASYDYFKKCAATGRNFLHLELFFFSWAPFWDFSGKCAQSKQEFRSEDSGLGPIDIQKNAFLNGNFATSVANAGSKVPSPDLSNNPFFQGGFAHAGECHWQHFRPVWLDVV